MDDRNQKKKKKEFGSGGGELFQMIEPLQNWVNI